MLNIGSNAGRNFSRNFSRNTGHNAAAARRRQRGLSLVEMMVGVTIGLVVVAGASLLMSTQLLENRRLLIETQLQQDLRASADIVTRELRRAGSQRDVGALLALWQPGSGSQHNQFADELTVGLGTVGFWYQPQMGLADPQLGFKVENDTLKRLDGAGWQELSDSNVMRITAFTPTLSSSAAIKLPCTKPCPDGTTGCWPSVAVREIKLSITGRAKNVTEVVERTIRSHVRLRNDHVVFSDKINNEMCPV